MYVYLKNHRDQRKMSDPLELEYQMVELPCGYRELSLGPLQQYRAP